MKASKFMAMMKGFFSSSDTPSMGAMNGVWLITNSGFDQLKTKMAMVSGLEAKTGTPSICSTDGNVAIIKAHGAMMRSDDFFTEYFGITTYESIVKSIAMANADDSITDIVMDFDTQGGVAIGNEVAAKAIRDSVKPVKAYVTEACSAGYFLASQCESITMSELSMVGSIGTVVEIVDYSAYEESYGVKTYTITSSNAPKKRFDIKTAEGQEIVQGYLDSMASVFVDFVAEGRGVSPEVVLNDFGQGGVIIGADAISVGMGDELGTLDSLVSGLKKEQAVDLNQIQGAIAALSDVEREALMADLVPAPMADAGEVTRITSIMSVATEHGDVSDISAIAEKAVTDGVSVAEFSKMVLDAKASTAQAFEDEARAKSLEAANNAKNNWAVAYKK